MSTNNSLAQTQNELPAFNKVIHIDVDVDSIYKKMMETLHEDYKHKEILSHAIVGSAVANGGINFVYNALNGYTNTIDFEEGDLVKCTEKKVYQRYDANKETEDGEKKEMAVNPASEEYKPNWRNRKIAVDTARVVEVNIYAENKLLIEFVSDSPYGDGKKEAMRDWVNHKTCTKMAGVQQKQSYNH